VFQTDDAVFMILLVAVRRK